MYQFLYVCFYNSQAIYFYIKTHNLHAVMCLQYFFLMLIPFQKLNQNKYFNYIPRSYFKATPWDSLRPPGMSN